LADPAASSTGGFLGGVGKLERLDWRRAPATAACDLSRCGCAADRCSPFAIVFRKRN